MEEILASIRRIISEDQEEKGAAAPAAARSGEGEADRENSELRDDTVLELTEIVGDAGAADAETPAAPEAAVPAASETEIPAAPAAEPRRSPVDPETLVSGDAARRTSAAFVDLAEQLDRAGGVALGGGRSLDELVEDLLRPMLKDWLDANLPPLVQRLVEREIARLAGRAEDEAGG